MAEFFSLLTSLHNQAPRFSRLHLIKFIFHSVSLGSTCLHSQSTSRICQLSLPGFLCAIHGAIWNYGYSLLSLEEHQHSVVLPQSNALPLWHSYVPLSHISCLDFIPLWCKECLGGCHCPELQKGVGYKSSASESPNFPESYLLFLWILIPGLG